MAPSTDSVISLILVFFLSSVSSLQFVSSSPICPLQSDLFLSALQSQCPLSFSSNTPIQVNGDFLDRAFTKQRDGYTSIIFYASWCPFSCNTYSTFKILSFMFPQIEHLAVEESSATPSVFSRYGIHSFPSILIVNQTSRVRYRGRKSLPSLVQFYKKTTGLDPGQSFTEGHLNSLSSGKKVTRKSWNWSSLREIVTREPYLTFSILFICLRALLYIFPQVLSCVKAFLVSHVPHLKLEIFGETSQIICRVLNMINLKRFWTKFRLCKTRNFREGAKNARVWASSLTSVSVGEPSSSRSSSS